MIGNTVNPDTPFHANAGRYLSQNVNEQEDGNEPAMCRPSSSSSSSCVGDDTRGRHEKTVFRSVRRESHASPPARWSVTNDSKQKSTNHLRNCPRWMRKTPRPSFSKLHRLVGETVTRKRELQSPPLLLPIPSAIDHEPRQSLDEGSTHPFHSSGVPIASQNRRFSVLRDSARHNVATTIAYDNDTANYADDAVMQNDPDKKKYKRTDLVRTIDARQVMAAATMAEKRQKPTVWRRFQSKATRSLIGSSQGP